MERRSEHGTAYETLAADCQISVWTHHRPQGSELRRADDALCVLHSVRLPVWQSMGQHYQRRNCRWLDDSLYRLGGVQTKMATLYGRGILKQRSAEYSTPWIATSRSERFVTSCLRCVLRNYHHSLMPYRTLHQMVLSRPSSQHSRESISHQRPRRSSHQITSRR